MNIAPHIQSQYLAALEMLKQVIVRCPANLWNSPGDTDPTWKKAYHALFYAHLYVQENEASFIPSEKHHDPDTGTPFSQAEVLEYLDLVRGQVKARVLELNFEAPSGFHWLKFDKLELQFYNIRHIQQHVGELYERLGSREQIELDWVSVSPV